MRLQDTHDLSYPGGANLNLLQIRKISKTEMKFLSLAITQIIEKICMEKLKYEEYESFQEIISGVYYRSKEINLNDNERFLGNTVKNQEHFVLEQEEDDSGSLKVFFQFLMENEKQFTLTQKKELIKKLNELNSKLPEYDLLIEKLTASTN